MFENCTWATAFIHNFTVIPVNFTVVVRRSPVCDFLISFLPESLFFCIHSIKWHTCLRFNDFSQLQRTLRSTMGGGGGLFLIRVPALCGKVSFLPRSPCLLIKSLGTCLIHLIDSYLANYHYHFITTCAYKMDLARTCCMHSSHLLTRRLSTSCSFEWSFGWTNVPSTQLRASLQLSNSLKSRCKVRTHVHTNTHAHMRACGSERERKS